ncbi:hypothetical protein J4733_12320 [Klebsiella pneumoniae]|uniref:Uncharacterized protein n=1 Tax=Klebsiella pneumoniae TaxID=573 RepID=A0A939NTU9_KLEPN|nr:hypothetical protein [Klebsiella pneumoniae]
MLLPVKTGRWVIPRSPMARGRLTRDWSVTSRRTQNDAFALKMYENAALLDKPVIDVVASIAESTRCQELMLQLLAVIKIRHHSTDHWRNETRTSFHGYRAGLFT